MNLNQWIRQIHRWVSIAFTVTVVANFVALAQGGGGMPPPWITYSPLPPLALLLFTGLYMFVLPYATRWRSRATHRLNGRQAARRRLAWSLTSSPRHAASPARSQTRC